MYTAVINTKVSCTIVYAIKIYYFSGNGVVGSYSGECILSASSCRIPRVSKDSVSMPLVIRVRTPF